MELIRAIREDKELQEMRTKWREKKDTPFPPYNYDEYGGIDDYKRKIRKRLEE